MTLERAQRGVARGTSANPSFPTDSEASLGSMPLSFAILKEESWYTRLNSIEYDLKTGTYVDRLAIVLNGKIIAAPKIVSPMSERAQISGRFSKEELQFLYQALGGGLVAPLPEQSRKSTPDNVADENLDKVAP